MDRGHAYHRAGARRVPDDRPGRGRRSFGGFLAHRIICVLKRGCADGDEALARAYGGGDAALVREHALNLVYEPGERQIPVEAVEVWAKLHEDGDRLTAGLINEAVVSPFPASTASPSRRLR
jgi:hypothetical protein